MRSIQLSYEGWVLPRDAADAAVEKCETDAQVDGGGGFNPSRGGSVTAMMVATSTGIVPGQNLPSV